MFYLSHQVRSRWNGDPPDVADAILCPEIDEQSRTLPGLDKPELGDSAFTVATLNNFLWVTFTRSNPSHDIYGTNSFYEFKHWGCRGPLIIDARIKPHHAPVLEEDPAVMRAVEKLAATGRCLHGII